MIQCNKEKGMKKYRNEDRGGMRQCIDDMQAEGCAACLDQAEGAHG